MEAREHHIGIEHLSCEFGNAAGYVKGDDALRVLISYADPSWAFPDGHRVMRWAPGAGTVVAGGRSQGSTLNQLRGPIGVAVDRDGAITVADAQNLSVFCGPTFARSPHLHT